MATRIKRKVQRVGQPTETAKIESAVERAVTRALKASRVGARHQVVSFFDFIRERGVIGLAIGIVIGTAVTALVHSLVEDIINPLISIVLVEDQLKGSAFKLAGATIGWGNFVSAVIDFLIIALTVYIIFRMLGLEKLDKKSATAAPKEHPKDLQT